MKTKTTIFIMLSLLLVMGCKKETQYEIYENHDISSFGVKDPLNNVEWLRQFCDKNQKSYSIDILLYQNIETSEDYIVIYSTDRGYQYSNINVYNSLNELIFHWNTGTSPSPQYEAFFSNKKEICKIWSVKEVL